MTPQPNLEDLRLVLCSLLPDEHLDFVDENEDWMQIISNPENSADTDGNDVPPFQLNIDGFARWIQVSPSGERPSITVNGENFTRKDQERWRNVVDELQGSLDPENEYPIYEVVTLNLLPRLREEVDADASRGTDPESSPSVSNQQHYHALFEFTSHHLVSSAKRRSLKQWSNSLSLSGFAKIGYPGIIYAEGDRTNVEEFVGNVKGMQWLALKLRFAEALPAQDTSNVGAAGTWTEFEKVGEVVEAMRGLGREMYVVQMGVGSLGAQAS